MGSPAALRVVVGGRIMDPMILDHLAPRAIGVLMLDPQGHFNDASLIHAMPPRRSRALILAPRRCTTPTENPIDAYSAGFLINLPRREIA
jgi:hypothetical protein